MEEKINEWEITSMTVKEFREYLWCSMWKKWLWEHMEQAEKKDEAGELNDMLDKHYEQWVEIKEMLKKPRHWEDCDCLWCEAYRDHQS